MTKPEFFEWLAQFKNTDWIRDTVNKYQFDVEELDELKRTLGPTLKLKKAFVRKQGA